MPLIAYNILGSQNDKRTDERDCATFSVVEVFLDLGILGSDILSTVFAVTAWRRCQASKKGKK